MLKEKLENFVKANRLEVALDWLQVIAEEKEDKDNRTQVISLYASLNNNEGRFAKGIIDYDALSLARARVLQAILDIIQDYDKSNYFEELDTEKVTAALTKGGQPSAQKSKILFIASNPIGTTQFEFEKEYLEIRRIFQKQRNQFEVTESFNTTFEQFFEVMKREQPEVLHISAPSTDKYLIFHRKDNTVRSIAYHTLSAVFNMFQPYLKCVFINTRCSDVFLKKVSIPTEIAIGSPVLVNDSAAIAFSSGFYTAIAKGRSYKEAFGPGIEVMKGQDWPENKRIPFVYFEDGVSNLENDQTPDEFTIEEPQEIQDILSNKTGPRVEG
ncbi:MAG: hypothetical protein AAFR66_07080 [Bacteroidota bacterium]